MLFSYKQFEIAVDCAASAGIVSFLLYIVCVGYEPVICKTTCDATPDQ